MNAAGHEFRPHIKAIRRSWFGMGIAGVTLRSLSMAAFRRRYSDVAVGLKLLSPLSFMNKRAHCFSFQGACEITRNQAIDDANAPHQFRSGQQLKYDWLNWKCAEFLVN